MHSALNQKLNAEIDLLLSADENPADIQVRLAPPEKFDEVGVPWSYFLSKIKFDTVVQPNGSVVVKLSSNEALKEPFLDFLVEVSWEKGNLYREFTVLIDPPAAYQQPVIPVVEKAVQAPGVDEQTTPVVEESLSAQPAPAINTSTEAVGKVAVDSYGPTTPRDTLWSIAENVKPSADIATEQMVMAIYQANPRAFYQDNVNALMSGSTLEIPDREAVIKLSKRQAFQLFKQQNQAWKAAVEQKPAQESVAEAEQQAEASQLELVAPVEAEVEEQVVVTPEQQAAAEQAPEEGSPEAAIAEPEVSEETAAVDETGDEPSTEQTSNLAMQARLEKLEQQLEMMQKLLVMKDEQLAALQNKQLLEQQQTQAATTEQVRTAEETVKPAQQSKPVDQPKPAPQPEPVEKAKPKAKAKSAPSKQAETSFFADNYYLLVGGLGVAILGVLGLWWRKRKVEEEAEAESMFASSSEIRMPDSDVSVLNVDDNTPAYDVGTVGESSFLSEFTPSDFDAFETDQNEVDPISEADVYLAYGRYQQAEELMRQAIKDRTGS
nr:FimV/HubP family polar landmark protein [Methylomarinum sp. Ch1-1]MDP4519351.1 FimV/HubP family polar landmark protein [Methylomarinum sp. Ch1-1]